MSEPSSEHHGPAREIVDPGYCGSYHPWSGLLDSVYRQCPAVEREVSEIPTTFQPRYVNSIAADLAAWRLGVELSERTPGTVEVGQAKGFRIGSVIKTENEATNRAIFPFSKPRLSPPPNEGGRAAQCHENDGVIWDSRGVGQWPTTTHYQRCGPLGIFRTSHGRCWSARSSGAEPG
jgi:hypothetical protein